MTNTVSLGTSRGRLRHKSLLPSLKARATVISSNQTQPEAFVGVRTARSFSNQENKDFRITEGCSLSDYSPCTEANDTKISIQAVKYRYPAYLLGAIFRLS